MNILIRPGAVKAEPAEHFLFSPADWGMYEKMLEIVGNRRVRVTFDGRGFEVMSISPLHEAYKLLFGLLFAVFAEELGVTMSGFGSTTFRRRARQRGLEPDQCFYMASIPRMADWRTLDRRGPVPDLAVEIDVTHSSLDRMDVYAGLRVPEVWRFDGDTLEVNHLVRGRYRRPRRSVSLPFVPLDEIPDLIRRCLEVQDDGLRLRAMRHWIRTRVLPAKEAAERRRRRRPDA